MTKLRKLFGDNTGATAIEYGLIAALIAVAAISAMTTLGKQIGKTMNNTAEAMAVG
jgi:pilus assembly protein Flp/PilA